MKLKQMRFFVGCLIVDLAVLGLGICDGFGAPSTYYVAPDGNDANPGTTQQPFLTLGRAQEAARISRSNGEAVSVIIHGGIYELGTSLDFNAADSGTGASPVIWKAAPGENVRIIGGQIVPPNAIQPVTDRDILQRVVSLEARKQLMQIDLATLGITNYGQIGPRGFGRPYVPAPIELFVDDKPLPLSRWPKPNDELIPIGKVLDPGSVVRNGDLPLRGGKFLVPTDRPKLWSKADDIWISGLFNYGYADDTVHLASIIESTNGIVFTTSQPHVYGFKSGNAWNAWYALNLLEEIELPGEYMVDRKAGKIYFLPPADVDMRKAQVSVSCLGEPLLVLKGASNLRFEHFTFECSRGLGVYIEGGDSCVLSSCTFHNLGILGVCIGCGIEPGTPDSNGVATKVARGQIGSLYGYLYGHSDFNRMAGSNHRIEDCSFYDLGAGGISLGGGDRKSLVPANNTVSNCILHTYNRWDRSYKAAINIDGVGNRIQHCLIYEAPGSAIYLHGNNHVVEYNEIHHVMQEGDDMGAFYMGRDPSEFGNIIRDNYFHDIGFGKTRKTWVLYYDDGACGTEAYGNLFVNAGRGGTVFVGGGKYNFTHDNIFVNCGLAICIDNRMQRWSKGSLAEGGLFKQRLGLMKIDRPPYSVHYPQLARYWDDNPALPADPVQQNLFVCCQRLTDGQPEWGPFADNWETKEDPGFVDLAGGDYRLKSDAKIFTEIPHFKPGNYSFAGPVSSTSNNKQ